MRSSTILTMFLVSSAESMSLSISAMVDKTLNCLPSLKAILLNEFANSSNSSPLFTMTRLSNSLFAILRVPSRRFSRGTRLLRIWPILSSSTSKMAMTVTAGKIILNSAIGVEIYEVDSPTITVHLGVKKLALRKMDQNPSRYSSSPHLRLNGPEVARVIVSWTCAGATFKPGLEQYRGRFCAPSTHSSVASVRVYLTSQRYVVLISPISVPRSG